MNKQDIIAHARQGFERELQTDTYKQATGDEAQRQAPRQAHPSRRETGMYCEDIQPGGTPPQGGAIGHPRPGVNTPG